MMSNMMISLLLVLVLLLHQMTGGASQQQQQARSAAVRQVLDGTMWTITNANASIQIPATVPGNVYTDLITAGILDDPYYRYNDFLYRWVANESSWTYSLTFDANSGVMSAPHKSLVFDGIDTQATITLNKQIVGVVSNMFRRYTFDITSVIISSGNVLTVKIDSPVLTAGNYSATYPYPVPVSDPDSEIPFRNFIRKAQSDFGWDWGIGLAPSGIWKSVTVVAFAEAIIADVTSIQTVDANGNGLVNATAFIRVSPQALTGVSGILQLVVGAYTASSGTISLPPCPSDDGDFVFAISVLMNVPQPELWWPAGYGAQPLYNLTYSFLGKTEISTVHRSIGFRTIRIVRDPLSDEPGLTFYFEVNSIPIYAKGANLVPLDAFHTRVSETNLTRILKAAVDANHNIVRVWGGGIYQNELLYDFADQHGLLVWQEFAFACAMYPVNDFFLVNIREEVTQQLRRLNHHASIAVFGGNNENEVALNWFPISTTYRDRYIIDYNNLYVNTIRDALIRELGLSVEYVVSSPSNGPKSLNPFTQIWGDGGSAQYGDMHVYDYSDDCSDVNIYPRGRFISEFGFQSYPSLLTLIPVTLPSDLYLNSDLMLHRQHHPDGNDQMSAQIQRHFVEPDPTKRFDDWVYVSQTVQSLCYSTAIQSWRRIKDEQGHTMGVIYWQLNDIWQAPSWSSIEWNGRWKLLHYTTKQVFEPLIVSPYLLYNNGNIGIYIVSDLLQEFIGSVAVELRQWSDGTIINTNTVDVSIPKLTSSKIFASNLTSILKGKCEINTCFLNINAISNKNIVASNQLWLSPIKNVQLVNPKISVIVSVDPKDSHSFSTLSHNSTKQTPASTNLVSSVTLTLSTAAPAPYTFLESPINGYFSNNNILLLSDVVTVLTFTGYDSFDPSVFQKSLKVRTIYAASN